MQTWFALPALALIWAWPSALFLPVILGQDSTPLRAASIAITVAVGLVLVWGCWRFLIDSPRWRAVAALLILLGACVLVLPLYYVLVQQGVLHGLGGDRGQALDIALERLLAGQYPYAARTYDGGQITPLPGGLLLAAPAYLLLGSSYFMTVYVTPLAAWLVYRVIPAAGGILALAIVFAPAFWADTLSSGDLVTTSLLAFAVALNAMRAAPKGGSGAYLWAIALGIVGATRVTSILIALLAAAILVNRGHGRAAIKQLAVVLAAFIAISLPLYLINPAEFSPLHTSSFVQGRTGQLLALVVVVAFVLACWRTRFAHSQPTIVVLAVAVSLSSIALTCIPLLVNLNDRTLFTTGYAVLALTAPLAVLAISRPRTSSPASSREHLNGQ